MQTQYQQDHLLQLQEESNSQSQHHQQDLKPVNYEPKFKSIPSNKMLIYDEEDQIPIQKVFIEKKSELRMVNNSSIERLKLNNFVQKKQAEIDQKNKRSKKRRIKIEQPAQKQLQFNPQILKRDSNKEKQEQKVFTKIGQNENKQQQQIISEGVISSMHNLGDQSNTAEQNSNLLKEKDKVSDLKMVPSSSSKRFLVKLNQQMFDASNVQKNTMFNQKIDDDDQYIIAKRKENQQILENKRKIEKQKKQLIKLAPLKNQQKIQIMRKKKEQNKQKDLSGENPIQQNKNDLNEEAEYERQLKKLLSKQKVKIRYSDILKNKSLKQFCKQSITFGRFVQGRLKRDKSGMNIFFPQYNVYLGKGTQKYLISAKKNLGSYSISTNSDRFDQNSQGYLGYIEGNFTGSIYNQFSQRKQENFKQIIATIKYDSQIVIGSQFRKIQIYIKNQNLLFNQLDGVDAQSSNNKNLCQLYYQFQSNKNLNKIIKLMTKEPTYIKESQVYALNFKGKVKQSSVKNMIIINEDKPDDQVMVFGKTDDHDFYLKISSPLSAQIAMGILMSSFDFKLASQ